MKINFLLVTLIMLMSTKLQAQVAWTDNSRILPDQLRNMPTGLVLSHSPSPVWPVLNTDTLNYSGKYIWRHQTSIKSEVGELEVVAIGSYIWFKGKGWQPNMNLTKQEFSELFHCPNGILKRNKTYTFLKNYRHGDSLYGGDALWFIIAKDKNGKLFKGSAIVETEGELNISAKP